MIGARSSWVSLSKCVRNFQHRRFCNNNKPGKLHGSGVPSSGNVKVSDVRDLEAYRDLDKLDFMKAARILFSDPPKKKKFGIDFHLVQLFFALMPPLAVYLVAQYARYEIKKMEAEVELKKKEEEEKKAKEMEAIAAEEKEAGSDPELLKVKERLEALEEAVKEMVVETKKRPSDEKSEKAATNQGRDDPNGRSDGSRAAAGNQRTSETATSGSGQQQKLQDRVKGGRSNQDEKR